MSLTSAFTRPTPTPSELNRPHWRGPGHRGFYEVWYLTVQDRERDRRFWFRHTLHLPSSPREPGYAALWAFSFGPEGEGLSLLDRYPLDRFQDRSGSGGFGLALGPGSLSAYGARGAVGAGDRRVAWDLRFEAAPGSFEHVSPRLYDIGLASSGVATPALTLAISGTVEVGGERFTLTDAVGEQGHVYGRRHADSWVWAHCHEVPGAPGVVFEGVSARVRKLGVLLPAASPMTLRLDGHALRWNDPVAMWRPHSTFELGRWEFHARCERQLLVGRITAPPASFVSVEYADPDGGRAYCNHTETADASFTLFDPQDGAWVVSEHYESAGRTAFEVGGRERDPRPRRALDLAEARPA